MLKERLEELKIQEIKGFRIFRNLDEMETAADAAIFSVYDIYPDMRVYNRNKEVLNGDIIKYHYYNTEALFKGIYVSPSIPEGLIAKLLKKHLDI